MIAFLEGVIAHISATSLIINVGGVGYKVFVTPPTLSKVVGEPIKLFTYHKSTDDGQALFGFPEASTLDFFELLLTVSGVGPKSALSILSYGNPDTLQEAIARQDTSLFSQIGGIGKKTAERIIVELKDKVGNLPGQTLTGSSNEILSALAGLGYSAGEVRHVIQQLDLNAPVEEQIRQALKLLSKG